MHVLYQLFSIRMTKCYFYVCHNLFFFCKLCFLSLPMYHMSFRVELTWSLTLYAQGWTLYRPGDETSQHRSPLQVGRTHPLRRDQRHGRNRPHAGSPGLWPPRKPTRLHETRTHGVSIQLLTGEADKLLIDCLRWHPNIHTVYVIYNSLILNREQLQILTFLDIVPWQITKFTIWSLVQLFWGFFFGSAQHVPCIQRFLSCCKTILLPNSSTLTVHKETTKQKWRGFSSFEAQSV